MTHFELENSVLYVASVLSVIYCANKSLKQAWIHVKHVKHIKKIASLQVGIIYCANKSLKQAWMYVEHVKHINAYNFLNNGPICNLLALLELSYSPLFTQYISFILMSNMSNLVQKIPLVFIHSNWMYVEHVEHIKAYNFLNNGPICNPLALLELSHSPLCTQHISFILMSNMSNLVQKIPLVFIHSNWMYVEHVEHIKAYNFLNALYSHFIVIQTLNSTGVNVSNVSNN